MDSELIREFTVISKYKSLSGASQELHITQPVLSKHLALLEKELGVMLFNRGVVPMELTVEGESFLSEACSLTARHSLMIQRMSSMKSEQILSVISVTGLLDTDVTRLLIKLQGMLENTEEPKISIRTVSKINQLPFNLLQNDEVDVVFEPYSASLDILRLISVPVFKDPAMLIVSKEHHLASRLQVYFGDLKKETFISLNNNQDTCMRKHVRSLCLKYRFNGGLPTDFQLRDMPDYKSLLLEGLRGGILVLPKSMIDYLPIFTLDDYAIIPINDEDCAFDMRAFFRNERSEKTAQFMRNLTICSEDLLTQGKS